MERREAPSPATQCHCFPTYSHWTITMLVPSMYYHYYFSSYSSPYLLISPWYFIIKVFIIRKCWEFYRKYLYTCYLNSASSNICSTISLYLSINSSYIQCIYKWFEDSSILLTYFLFYLKWNAKILSVLFDEFWPKPLSRYRTLQWP